MFPLILSTYLHLDQAIWVKHDFFGYSILSQKTSKSSFEDKWNFQLGTSNDGKPTTFPGAFIITIVVHTSSFHWSVWFHCPHQASPFLTCMLSPADIWYLLWDYGLKTFNSAGLCCDPCEPVICMLICCKQFRWPCCLSYCVKHNFFFLLSNFILLFIWKSNVHSFWSSSSVLFQTFIWRHTLCALT